MKRWHKLKIVREKFKKGEPITVLFPNDMNTNIEGYKCKCKTGPFENFIMQDKRFKVIETNSRAEYVKVVPDIDLIFPPLLYAMYSHLNDPDLYDQIVIERKLMFIRYSLGWHVHVNQIYNAQACLVFCDLPELIQKPYHVLTGHPWSEVLMKPASQFNDPWQTTNKKRILLCPHWTLQKDTYTKYGNKTNFLEVGSDLIRLVDEYKSEVEFVVRPHPNMYYQWKSDLTRVKKKDVFAKAAGILDKLSERCLMTCDNDHVDWFKHSDAMIHDCGSFRCEYLYMDKPVCYMANDVNMDPKIWSQMGKDAIDCHELVWPEHGEKLDTFIRNVIDGKDVKSDLRKEYIAKYCTNFPNGKTPCENIVNAILGLEEYKGLKPPI